MSSLTKSIEKYNAIFKVQLSDRLAYAGDLISQSIAIVVFMWVFAQLWRATFESSGQSAIAGLTLNQTLWYFMAAEVIMVSRPKVFRAISDAVKDGSIAYILNKPYDFLLYYLSISLGDLLSRALFNLLVGTTVVWLMVGPPPSITGFGFFIAAFLGAWLLDFCANAMIGLAAFLSEEVAPYEWIYSKFLLVAGGVLIPLDFFPEAIRAIAIRLPFAYTIYAPARLFIEPSTNSLIQLLAGQLFWLVLLGGLLAWVYRKAIGYLNINGG